MILFRTHNNTTPYSNSSSLIDIVHITALHASQDCSFQQQLTYEHHLRHSTAHITRPLTATAAHITTSLMFRAHNNTTPYSNSSLLIDIVHITALHALQNCSFQQPLTYEHRLRHSTAHITRPLTATAVHITTSLMSRCTRHKTVHFNGSSNINGLRKGDSAGNRVQ